MYITSIIEVRVHPRGSNLVTRGCPNLGPNIASFRYFQEMHSGQSYVFLNQKKGKKNIFSTSKITYVDFEWGFLVKPHDFYDFYVQFLSQLNGFLQDLEVSATLSPVDSTIQPLGQKQSKNPAQWPKIKISGFFPPWHIKTLIIHPPNQFPWIFNPSRQCILKKKKKNRFPSNFHEFQENSRKSSSIGSRTL